MKRILDACCGARMFWFDKNNPDVVFMDRRKVSTMLCDGRQFVVNPDVIGDFTDIPYADNWFNMVVFDPPHLIHAGKTSWLALKYGTIEGDWKDMIRKGFKECLRVLKKDGVLIMKWSSDQISTKDVLQVLPMQPLFGYRRGKSIFLVFMKS
ncbi:MAG: SAM-dependent methyltransferase [Dialister invisus]|uniref:SAM-dependent methyltransferase n=1 Tax=Dialister invisus TaxID=218538 RepID=UPI0039922BBC